MKIKAIFFDAGETIVYRNPSLTTIVHRFLLKHGRKINKKRLASIINQTALTMKPIAEKGKIKDSKKWQIYISKLFWKLAVKNQKLADELRERLRKGTSFRLFNDVLQVINVLKKSKIITGIISNASIELNNILIRAKVFNKFDYIVISEKIGIEKPNKGIFEKALKMAKVNSGEMVFVGDNYIADVIGAQNAGIIPVWIKRITKNSEFSFNGNDYKGQTARKITDLSGIIELSKSEGWI